MWENLNSIAWIYLMFGFTSCCIPTTPIETDGCPSSIYVANCGDVTGGVECQTAAEAAVSITREVANDRCILSFSCPSGTDSYIWMSGSSTNPFLYSGSNLVFAPDDQAGNWYLSSGLQIFQLTCMNIEDVTEVCIAHIYADNCGEIPNYSFYTCPTASEAETTVVQEDSQCRQSWTCPESTETYVWILGGSNNPIPWTDSFVLAPLSPDSEYGKTYLSDGREVTQVSCICLCTVCTDEVYVEDCGGIAGGTECQTAVQAAVEVSIDITTSQCVLTFTCPAGTYSYIWYVGATDNPTLAYDTSTIYSTVDAGGTWYSLTGQAISQITCMFYEPITSECPESIYVEDCGGVSTGTECQTAVQASAVVSLDSANSQCLLTITCPVGTYSYVWYVGATDNPSLALDTDTLYSAVGASGFWYSLSGQEISQITCMLYEPITAACSDHIYAENCGDVPEYSYYECPTTAEVATEVTEDTANSRCRQSWTCPAGTETFVWYVNNSPNPMAWAESFVYAPLTPSDEYGKTYLSDGEEVTKVSCIGGNCPDAIYDVATCTNDPAFSTCPTAAEAMVVMTFDPASARCLMTWTCPAFYLPYATFATGMQMSLSFADDVEYRLTTGEYYLVDSGEEVTGVFCAS